MLINLGLGIWAMLIILWLYGLIFDHRNDLPSVILGIPISQQTRSILGVLCYPFIQLYKLFKWILRWLIHVIVDIVFELLIIGLWHLLWAIIRGFFMLIFRILD